MARKTHLQALTAFFSPRKYSITRIYWLGLVVLASVPTLLLGYLWVSDQYRIFQEQSAALRQTFLDSHKQFLRREADEALDYIEFKTAEIDQRLLDELKKNVGSVVQALEPPFRAKAPFSREQLRLQVRESLSKVRFGGGSDHFFLLDETGRLLLMPVAAALAQTVDTAADAGILRFLPALIESARASGDAATAAWLPKPDGGPGSFAARIYLRFYPALNIFVGAIGYEEDMVAISQREVLARFRRQSRADDMAITVCDYQGLVLMNTTGTLDEGRSIHTLRDAGGQLLAASVMAATDRPEGVMAQPHWRNGSSQDLHQYLSYARAYPAWRWVVLTSFPVGELEVQIAQQRGEMKRRVQQRIAYVGLIVLGLLMVATLSAQRLAGKTRHALRQFNQFFAESNRQNTRIDIDKLPLTEFEQLAVDANRMLDYRLGVEHELIAARIAAEEANQAKSQFLSTMSHELRTPLNGVLGYAQILMRDPALTLDQQRHLNAIQSCGQHLLTLINDVLDLAKIESGALEVVARDCYLYALLEGASDVVRGKAEAKGLAYFLEISPNLPQHVWIDEVKLRQILINLLGNAVKFTDAGTVTLSARSSADGEHLIFEISDTGIGIDRQRLQEIFHPFRQLQAHGGGTGLGLAISQRVCAAMGGQLDVDSARGAGSRFTLILPLVPVHPDKAAPPLFDTIATVEPGSEHLRIMVVDDNADNRQVLTGLLRSVGAEIIEAEHGADALGKLRLQPVPLVLMDVHMPVMNGMEATRQIKADPVLCNTVVIAVSASVFPDVIEQMRAAGCVDFINKPVHLPELLQKISQHLGVSLRMQAVPVMPDKIAVELLPADVRGVLQTAIAEGDIEAMYAALQRAEYRGGSGAEVARHLRALLNKFEIEAVRDLLAQGVGRV